MGMSEISTVREQRALAQSKLDRISRELAEIDERTGNKTMTGGDKTRWDRLLTGRENLELEVAGLRDQERSLVGEYFNTYGEAAVVRGDGGLVAEYGRDSGLDHAIGPVAAARAAAMRTLDAAVRSKLLPEYAAARVENLLGQGPQHERSLVARWAAATGDPAYRSAFVKLAADPQRGHLLWSGAERAAYVEVTEVRTAMNISTGAGGGYMVPLTLDPTIMLSSSGSINPLRRHARVVQTLTDKWVGVTSAGATAEWKGEGAEVADGSPTLGTTPIPVEFADVFVPFSYEVGMDAENFIGEIAKVLSDAADNLMSAAYTTGTGSGQPTGLITALAGGSSVVAGGGSEALIAADPFALQNALPARFSPNASWQAHIATINTMRQMETTNGALKFPELANGQLLGKPMLENSSMTAGPINPAVTANNYVLLYGDLNEFVIVDRIGAQLEFIQNLFGTDGRPTGQRGAFLWFRTGSNVTVANGFRMLNVPTTA